MLEDVAGFSDFSSDSGDSFPQLFDELACLANPYTQCFFFQLHSVLTGGSAGNSGTFMSWRLQNCLQHVQWLSLLQVGAICTYVSGIITSHARHFPDFHGIKVTPSGCLLSLRSRPGGSFAAGVLHVCMTHRKMSFTMPCYPCRTVMTRQTMSASTFYLLPTWTDCGLQMLTLSLIPVVILLVSFVNPNPTAVMGVAGSLECGAAAALSLD